ncbi:MAG: ROK family protein, partial [Pseudonocardiales bacterium]|nr:ROK family protein [Pseudonocardiales bacterium]
SAGAIVRRLAAECHAVTSIGELRAAIGRGDPAAVGAVRDAAGLIGERVATLVHLYNPARVAIGGALTAASDDLLAGVRAVVYQRALPLATRNLVLAASVLGEHAGLAGAAVLGIEEVLSAESIDGLGGPAGRTARAPARA